MKAYKLQKYLHKLKNSDPDKKNIYQQKVLYYGGEADDSVFNRLEYKIFDLLSFLPKDKTEINILEVGAGTACISHRLCDVYLKDHKYSRINYYLTDYDKKDHFLSTEIKNKNNIYFEKLYEVNANSLSKTLPKELVGKIDLIISINPFYYGLLQKEGHTYKPYLDFVRESLIVLNENCKTLIFSHSAIIYEYRLLNELNYTLKEFEKEIETDRRIKDKLIKTD